MMTMIHAQLHQDHHNSGKMVLQALIPFVDLRDVVLFTCRTSPKEATNNRPNSVVEENYRYYQRRIDKIRLSKIKGFIKNSILAEDKGFFVTALFPTSLILAVSEEDGNIIDTAEDDTRFNVDLKRNVFIVDGQHRLMAMISLYNEMLKDNENSENKVILDFLKKYKFSCTILVNYDLWEQGQVFVNVNFRQKPVNKSLYYEIFGSNYNEDPNMWKQNHIYIAHNLTKVLNTHDSSPYKGHIKMLGTGKGFISQAFLVEAIMRHFSIKGIWSIYKERIDNNTDIRYMAVELLSYFSAVKDVFSEYWPKHNEDKGTIICKTTGTGAFFRLMTDIHDLAEPKIIDSLKNRGLGISEVYFNFVKNKLTSIDENAADRYFGQNSKYNGSSGQGSENKLYMDLKLALQINICDRKLNNNEPSEDVIAELLQNYLCTHVLSELDCLGHKYSFDGISDFKISETTAKENSNIAYKLKFQSAVTIYLDSDDETGLPMSFPSNARITLYSDGKQWELDSSTLNIKVDTTKYYQ